MLQRLGKQAEPGVQDAKLILLRHSSRANCSMAAWRKVAVE
jgi:hypothetical protein